MGIAGASIMGRPKGRPKAKLEDESSAARTTIISLKGTQKQADWLESVHRKTHIPKAVIIRLALAEWAKSRGYGPFPTEEGEK